MCGTSQPLRERAISQRVVFFCCFFLLLSLIVALLISSALPCSTLTEILRNVLDYVQYNRVCYTGKKVLLYKQNHLLK